MAFCLSVLELNTAKVILPEVFESTELCQSSFSPLRQKLSECIMAATSSFVQENSASDGRDDEKQHLLTLFPQALEATESSNAEVKMIARKLIGQINLVAIARTVTTLQQRVKELERENKRLLELSK